MEYPRHLRPVARLKRIGLVNIVSVFNHNVYLQAYNSITRKEAQYVFSLTSGNLFAVDNDTWREMRQGDKLMPVEWVDTLITSALVELIEADLTADQFLKSLKVDGFDISTWRCKRNYRGHYTFWMKADDDQWYPRGAGHLLQDVLNKVRFELESKEATG